MAGHVQQTKQMFENLQALSVTRNKPEPKPLLQKTEDYASEIFQKPMVLIDNESGIPICNTKTLSELSKIEKTLNIVSVVGTFRSGKSFLLNKLAAGSKDDGFQTGHTTKPVTKGIWVLCRPHPTQSDQVLVLLDTEGFDDPGAVQILDSCVFILTNLLSSTLVYNTKGNLDRSTIDKFEFLEGMKTSIAVVGSDMDDSILDFFFPTFVLCLRDVTLDITQGPDQFLEEHLELFNGMSDSVRKYNLPRQLIRRYYKKRKCFIFEKPVKRERLSDLMKIPDNELKKGFQATLSSFRDYVLSCPPKTLKCGRGINGRMFGALLKSYVNSVKDGQRPNIHVAMKKMAEAENAHAIQKAADVYNTEMKQKLAAYDTPTGTGLTGFHTTSMNAALDILKSELLSDDKQIYEEQAMLSINQHLENFKISVDRNSRSICNQRLQKLNMQIVGNMKSRAYQKPTGYDKYMKDIEWIVKQYRKEKKYLGTQFEVCLQEFLDGKKSEEETVYQWVVEAQNEQSDAKMKSVTPVKRMSRGIKEMEDGQTEYVDSEDDTVNIESGIKGNIESMQVDGMKRIESQFSDMLKLKIDELERMRKEVSEEDPMFKQLVEETEFWKELAKNASWNHPKYKTNGEQHKQERKGKCIIV